MDGNRILWICAAPPQAAACELRRRTGWRMDYRPPDLALDAMPGDCAAIVLDFPIDGWSPAELLHRVKGSAPDVPVLIRDPRATLSDAVRLARLGAWQFLSNDEDPTEPIEQAIQERATRDLARLSQRVGGEDWERLLVGDSREMRQVHHLIRMIGGRRATVLITGETGTGKEIAARCLHLAGSRRRGPLVAVNCGALPENLLEAELFGHVRGAFTGAVQNRTGRFEQAQGGTLFLDEIGELPMDLQVKLLRVLQEREFQRLGSSETIHADVRVVAATNSDLAGKIEEGRFREDLYYRLNVVPIHMPPLRQRSGDIPPLAGHLVAKICRLEEIPLKSFDGDALAWLSGYSWPGNVRQLENAIEMAVAMSGERAVLTAADFPLPAAARALEATESAAPVVELPEGGIDYERTLASIERSILEQALRKTGGNKKAAAQMLRLKRTTLSAKVRSLGQAACN
jgi:DNA-binding NtrC family response regulator